MGKTSIEWTDATWNPIRARNRATGKVGHFCVHVSPGCENCYAERMQPRFGNPIRYAKHDLGKVEMLLDEKVLREPLSWKKPRRVFVCSMTDLFGEWVPFSWWAEVANIIKEAPRHTFQVLTKRQERMRDAVIGWLGYDDRRVLGNLWLGVSVENQATADERIPLLLDTPAAVRFISAEPLLEPILFRNAWVGGRIFEAVDASALRLDLVIVGGESGPNARPCDLAWLRSVVEQCKAAGVPCFMKQIGSNPAPTVVKAGSVMARLFLKDSKGGNPDEWPEDLRVREWPLR